MKKFFSTKEVAEFLNVNEKMVYALISEKGLPAAKITGKWLFPRHLVEQWIETNTLNYPEPNPQSPPYAGLLIIAGSNDPLLDRAIHLFNHTQSDHMAVFGNLGSMGGLRALRKNLCHIGASHLLQNSGDEYNFAFATQELERQPAIVNFCQREQGLLVQAGNPLKIQSVADLGRSGIRILNRPLSTGTRLLLDRELKKAALTGSKIQGYETEVARHLDVGLAVLSGQADTGMAIRPVASLLGLDFIPLRWERFDLMIPKMLFFDPGVQHFLALLHDESYHRLADEFSGYDLSLSGKMVYPSGSPQ